MYQIFQLVICIALGLIAAWELGLRGLEGEVWYAALAAVLLAVGLYGSTYGIDRTEARKHLRIIISAVTVGVLFKALLIGGTLALIFGKPEYLLLGVIVAQIDPLSVAGLMRGSRMSQRAKTILGSWASFDDPITVLLALYAPVLVSSFTDAAVPVIPGVANGGLGAYLTSLAANLGFAAVVYVLLKLAKRQVARYMVVPKDGVYWVLSLLLAVAASAFWMLGIAIVGLFFRPAIERLLERAITWALHIAAIMVGLLLIGGLSIGPAIILGVVTFVAQIIAGMALTGGLPMRDRLHIAFAQQNGITAIILALLFEQSYAGTVAIVAPAIIVVNILHVIGNKLLDRHLVATA
jgi:NhaP-type Na+/H+ or K+/H+ antiporter